MRFMNRTLFVIVFFCFFMVSCGNESTDPVMTTKVKMTFEGLTDNESVREYYNGGYGYDSLSNLQKSGPGPNYGVTFLTQGNIVARIDSDAGGNGNFGGEPSPSTAIEFQNHAWMNVAAGFKETLSFYYTNPNGPAKIYIYDGLDKTGNLLATVDLPQTAYAGAPDPTGNLSPFVLISVSFDGIAKSVDFGDLANSAYIDDIEFEKIIKNNR